MNIAYKEFIKTCNQAIYRINKFKRVWRLAKIRDRKLRKK